MMANLGMADTLILMVLALVVFGPRRLPQIGRQIGKLMYEFRKASNDFKFQMEEELRQAEEADRRKKQEEERKRALAASPPAPQIEASSAPALESNKPADAEAPLTPAPEAPDPEAPDPGAPDLDKISPEAAAYFVARASAEPTAPAPGLDAAPALPAQPAEPRILPPTSGEQVAADRPGATTAQQDLFAPDARVPGESPETAPETERSEPAAHHG